MTRVTSLGVPQILPPFVFGLVASLTAAASPAGAHPAEIQAARAPGAFIGAGDMMPAIKRQVLPAYPQGAMPGGVVDLEIVVDIGGSVVHARVAQSPDASGTLDRVCTETCAHGNSSRPSVQAARPSPRSS